ncbi:MAG: hypothetical protein HW388_758 [Dehalococcoidia bacterium]|nr:hypothetical protein [Dehalococcoidia bacterium]
MKVLPLKLAYEFGNNHDLRKEINTIQNLPITPVARRGETVGLFAGAGILKKFIEVSWPDGATRSGQTSIRRYVRKANEFRESRGEPPIVVPNPKDVTKHDSYQPSKEIGEPDITQQLLTRILALNPSQFDKLLGEFLKAKGFSEVRATGRAGEWLFRPSG